MPDKATSVRLADTKGVRYDLLRSGIAAGELEAGPDKPVLTVERKSRIAKLAIDKELNITLSDEHGAPVDLSVVRVEVFDPAGHLVRYYSTNVTVRDGRASLPIPFAISDARGDWSVRARDVISGLTAQTVITPGTPASTNQRAGASF